MKTPAYEFDRVEDVMNASFVHCIDVDDPRFGDTDVANIVDGRINELGIPPGAALEDLTDRQYAVVENVLMALRQGVTRAHWWLLDEWQQLLVDGALSEQHSFTVLRPIHDVTGREVDRTGVIVRAYNFGEPLKPEQVAGMKLSLLNHAQIHHVGILESVGDILIHPDEFLMQPSEGDTKSIIGLMYAGVSPRIELSQRGVSADHNQFYDMLGGFGLELPHSISTLTHELGHAVDFYEKPKLKYERFGWHTNGKSKEYQCSSKAKQAAGRRYMYRNNHEYVADLNVLMQHAPERLAGWLVDAYLGYGAGKNGDEVGKPAMSYTHVPIRISDEGVEQLVQVHHRVATGIDISMPRVRTTPKFKFPLNLAAT